MSLRAWFNEPERRITLHTWATVIWAVLTVFTTIWAVLFPDDPRLIAWLIFISCYAIVVGHWGAREGAAPSARG